MWRSDPGRVKPGFLGPAQMRGWDSESGRGGMGARRSLPRPRVGLVQRRPLASGDGLCIRCLVPVRGFLIPRIPRGAVKEETMKLDHIALIIAAIAQFVAAAAAVIGAIRCGP